MAAGLLSGEEWEAAKPQALTALRLDEPPSVQPQDLQWLREVIALNTAEPSEGPQDDEDDPDLEFS